MNPSTVTQQPGQKQVSHSGRCTVRIAKTREEVEALRTQWLQFRKSYSFPSPDADPDFFLSIYHHLGKDVLPYVVLFQIDNRTCAALVSRMVTRPLGNVGSNYLNKLNLKCLEIVYGGLMSDGAADSRSVLLDHLDGLLRSSTVHLLEVHHLDVTHELANDLRARLEATAKAYCVNEVHWLLEIIDPTTGQTIEHNSSKTRSTFRRKDKKLVETFTGDVELLTFVGVDEVGEFLRAAASITAQTYQAAIEVGVLETPRWRAIIQALAAYGRFRGYLLMAHKRPIAYIAGALFDRHFTLLATSFAPVHRKLSPGIVLINRVIAELRAESVEVFDFGFGDADYKELLGSTKREQLMIRLYGPGWRSSIGYSLDIISRLARIAGKRTIRSLGAFDVVKRKWRRRLESQASVRLKS